MKDLSHLDGAKPIANPPTKHPVIGPAVVKAWDALHPDTPRDKAFDTALRNSWAGMCARAISYHMAGTEQTNPPSVADRWRMSLGTAVHDIIQQAYAHAFPDAQAEVKIDMRGVGLDSSGNIDMVATVRSADEVASIEIKSVNGFGFKCAVGAQGVAEGPKQAHLAQAALNAKGVDADTCCVVYFSMENISPVAAKKAGLSDDAGRFTAEWWYTQEEYTQVADREIARLNKILELVDQGKEVPRSTPNMPTGARITDPSTGNWELTVTGDDGSSIVVDHGSEWVCNYCSFQDLCVKENDHA